jgi:hypothetical protein
MRADVDLGVGSFSLSEASADRAVLSCDIAGPREVTSVRHLRDAVRRSCYAARHSRDIGATDPASDSEKDHSKHVHRNIKDGLRTFHWRLGRPRDDKHGGGY